MSIESIITVLEKYILFAIYLKMSSIYIIKKHQMTGIIWKMTEQKSMILNLLI